MHGYFLLSVHFVINSVIIYFFLVLFLVLFEVFAGTFLLSVVVFASVAGLASGVLMPTSSTVKISVE